MPNNKSPGEAECVSSYDLQNNLREVEEQIRSDFTKFERPI